MRERFGHCRKFGYGIEQGIEIAGKIAHQAFRQVALEAWELRDELAEAELLIVEGVDQLAHGLNALAKLSAVLGEAGRGNVPSRDRRVYGIARELAAA